MFHSAWTEEFRESGKLNERAHKEGGREWKNVREEDSEHKIPSRANNFMLLGLFTHIPSRPLCKYIKLVLLLRNQTLIYGLSSN